MRVFFPRLLPVSALVLVLVPGGCKPTTPALESGTGVSPRAWQIRSYSETVPFTSVTRLSGKIYAGTPAGVIRFDEDNGEFVRLTRREGLTGDHVFAVSGDPGSGLWVATDNGLARSHNDVWTNFPMGNPPGEGVSAMVATVWGVWAGGPNGLGRFKDGKWSGYLRGARVTALVTDLTGDGVWVGTDGEGIHHWRSSTKSFVNHSPASGQSLRHVRGLAYTKSGGIVGVGTGDGGHGLVFFDGKYWTTYRPSPAGRLRWIQMAADELLMAYKDRILVLRAVEKPEAPLPSGPVLMRRMLAPGAPPDYPAPRFYTAPLDRWLPPEATVVLPQAAGVLIGTRTAGLVRYDGKYARWFRTNDLVGEGDKLKMACSTRHCFLSDGQHAYRYVKESFERFPVDPDPATRVVAFLDGPGAVPLAVLGLADGKTLAISRLDGDKWSRQREYQIAIPHGVVEVNFARLAPGGEIWIGLRYRDHEGESLPWGVGLLRPDGTVLYHRSALLPTEDRAEGSLALPDDVRDVRVLGGAMWLATGTGACKVKGNQVELYTENEGLESEIVHTLGQSLEGQTLAATHGGLGRFNGKQWRFDFKGALKTSTRALLREGDALWIGTAQGLVRMHKGGKQETLDSRLGLADDEVYDLYRDPMGRLWVLTAKGLSVIARSPAK